MLANGLALAGFQLNTDSNQAGVTADPTGVIQEIESELDWRSYPDITVRAGVPVRWNIHAGEGKITGCNNEMVIAALDLRVPLQEGDNIVKFTATEPGMIEYTCWMGMLHGTITVTE